RDLVGEAGLDLVLLEGGADEIGDLRDLLAGGLQHLHALLAGGALRLADLAAERADGLVELRAHLVRDVESRRRAQRRVDGVAAADGAREAHLRRVGSAGYGIALAFVGARIVVVGRRWRTRSAGAAGAGLRTVAHVPVVATGDPGARLWVVGTVARHGRVTAIRRA